MNALKTLTALLALLLSVPLLADDDGRAAELAEHRAALKAKWQARFVAADADGNGLLSAAEVAASALPGVIKKHFAEIDTDHDQGLSPDELLALQDRRLQPQKLPPAPQTAGDR